AVRIRRRHPRGAVPRRDPRAAGRRGGRGRRDAGEPAGRRPHRQGGAARPRVLRLLLPDRGRRLLGRAGIRLLRDRPPQVRAVAPPPPDPELRPGPRGVLPRARARAPDHHRAGRPRPPRAQRPLDRRPHRLPVARRAAGTGPCSGPQLAVAGPQRIVLAAYGGNEGDRPGRRPSALPGDPAHRHRVVRPEPPPRPRRRMGLRHGVEAAGQLAGVRRLAPGDPPRSRRRAPRSPHRRTHAGADVGAQRPAPDVGARRRQQRHRPGRHAHGALGPQAVTPRHAGADRRRAARRDAVAGARETRGLRGALPLAGRLRRRGDRPERRHGRRHGRLRGGAV
ncbi:MAG: Lysophospholipase, partial [uncultured Nocardioidaceae bacterium]